MDHNWVTAIGTALSALASVVLIVVATVQLRGLREQVRQAGTQIKQASDQECRRNTLQVVQRMESDQILRSAIKNIWEATNHGTDYTQLGDTHRFDCFTILNYLQGVAIGIEQQVYIEAMTKDYLDSILFKAVRALIKGESGEGWKSEKGICLAAEFSPLIRLYDKWFPEKKSEYRTV